MVLVDVTADESDVGLRYGECNFSRQNLEITWLQRCEMFLFTRAASRWLYAIEIDSSNLIRFMSFYICVAITNLIKFTSHVANVELQRELFEVKGVNGDD